MFSKKILVIFTFLFLAFQPLVAEAKAKKINNIFLQKTSLKLAQIYKEFTAQINGFENLKSPILISAFGKSSTEELFFKAEEVDLWEFTFLLAAKDTSSSDQAVLIGFEGGVFTEPQVLPSPPFGTEFKSLPNNMSLKKAIKIAQKAGHKDGFLNVVLRKTLSPGNNNHQYIFEVNNPEFRFVFVDTKTGKVSVE